MAMKWRFCLLAIIAAAVVGGLMPHGAVNGTETAATEIVQAGESPLSVPISCFDATCGKGTPAAPAPSPGVALVVAVVGGLAALALIPSIIRRRRLQAAVLPAGIRDPLFHPPQFS
jgi:hypothetical protein